MAFNRELVPFRKVSYLVPLLTLESDLLSTHFFTAIRVILTAHCTQLCGILLPQWVASHWLLLSIHSSWFFSLQLHQPKLAFVAAKDIPTREELTIDYCPQARKGKGRSTGTPGTPDCRCEGETCRGYIYGWLSLRVTNDKTVQDRRYSQKISVSVYYQFVTPLFFLYYPVTYNLSAYEPCSRDNLINPLCIMRRPFFTFPAGGPDRRTKQTFDQSTQVPSCTLPIPLSPLFYPEIPTGFPSYGMEIPRQCTSA